MRERPKIEGHGETRQERLERLRQEEAQKFKESLEQASQRKKALAWFLTLSTALGGWLFLNKERDPKETAGDKTSDPQPEIPKARSRQMSNLDMDRVRKGITLAIKRAEEAASIEQPIDGGDEEPREEPNEPKTSREESALSELEKNYQQWLHARANLLEQVENELNDLLGDTLEEMQPVDWEAIKTWLDDVDRRKNRLYDSPYANSPDAPILPVIDISYGGQADEIKDLITRGKYDTAYKRLNDYLSSISLDSDIARDMLPPSDDEAYDD